MSVLKRLGIKIPAVSVLKDERHKPKDILGDKEFVKKYKREILLANSEAHRFAIAYHKNLRNRNFLI
jgi:excinuclease UvrABC nuclease subunit